jgi:hypothetical protein
MIHYAADLAVNQCIARLVAIFDRAPYDFDAAYGDKTVDVVLATVRAFYGDFAASARITVH